MANCLIALGANLGDRHESLDRAIAMLIASGRFDLRSQSAWHETAAVGGPANQAAYLNGAALLETKLAPLDVLAELQRVETGLGRVRETRWGPRSIDLDLLVYDDLVIESPALVVPHPRMPFRRFVIEPAAEAAPDLRHPVIGWTMRELRDHLRHAPLYVAFAGPPGVAKTQLARRLADEIGGQFIADPAANALHSGPPDSAGRTVAEEIELLALRGKLLPRANAVPTAPIVSDFWLPQSSACAEAAGDSRFSSQVAGAVAEQVSKTLRPKLLVLVEGPADDAREATTGEALRRGARRPGVGPLLQLASGDATANFAEITAAVAAMK